MAADHISLDFIKEITPLRDSDSFAIFYRTSNEFTEAFHYHEEFQLTLLLNADGAERRVGDTLHQLDSVELVLLGSNVPHGWKIAGCGSKFTELTILWDRDFFTANLFRREQLRAVSELMKDAQRGISFNGSQVEGFIARLFSIRDKSGFEAVLELMGLINDLSTASRTLIVDRPFSTVPRQLVVTDRMERVLQFIHHNYSGNITLGKVAKLAKMTEPAFSRFFKSKLGISYVSYLNEVRLKHAKRMLIESDCPVSEVSSASGFNNLSNFNRMFKEKTTLTPVGFKQLFAIYQRFV